jgi:hypothetical protein
MLEYLLLVICQIRILHGIIKIMCKTLNIKQVLYIFQSELFMAYYIPDVIYI